MLGKKIPTIVALLLLGVLIGSSYFFINKTKVATSPEETPNNIKITNVADNKFSVSWTTKAATVGSVEYGSNGEKLTQKATDDKGNGKYKTHHVTVSELQPNTQYSFRILTGEPGTRYDNKGVPYTTLTGPTITSLPVARNIYGEVAGASEDTLVYITLPGANPSSTVLKNNGAYNLSVATVRTSDLKSYVTIDPSATVVGITLEDGKQTTQVSASTANIAPVPLITMGKNDDFRNTTEMSDPQIAEVMTAPNEELVPQKLEIYNVEPLAETPDVNVISNSDFSITNPSIEGEVLTSTKPEFRGTGDNSSTITIAVSGQKAVSDTVTIDADGEWKWTPPIELKVGKQKVAISYTDSSGNQKKLERSFSISATKVDSVPAIVATSSASVKPTATPRTAMPATESGVPVTGVMTPTIVTMSLALVMMMAGTLLFVF